LNWKIEVIILVVLGNIFLFIALKMLFYWKSLQRRGKDNFEMVLIRNLLAAIYVYTNWKQLDKKWLYTIYILLFSFSATLHVIIIYGSLGGGFNTDIFRFALVCFFSIFFNASFTVIDDRKNYIMHKYTSLWETSYRILEWILYFWSSIVYIRCEYFLFFLGPHPNKFCSQKCY
jgi:hypothetical protein